MSSIAPPIVTQLRLRSATMKVENALVRSNDSSAPFALESCSCSSCRSIRRVFRLTDASHGGGRRRGWQTGYTSNGAGLGSPAGADSKTASVRIHQTPRIHSYVGRPFCPLLHRPVLSRGRDRHARVIGEVGGFGGVPGRPDMLWPADGEHGLRRRHGSGGSAVRRDFC